MPDATPNAASSLASRLGAFAASMSAVVGVASGYFALQAQLEAKAANSQLAEHQLQLAAVQTAVTRSAESRADRESHARLDQFVYAEIVKLFELAENTPDQVRARREKVVSGLVLAMASQGMKEPFTQALAIQIRSPELAREANAVASFYRQNSEAALHTSTAPPVAPARPGEPRNPLKGLRVDLFYCAQENRDDQLKKKADDIAEAMPLKAPGTTWRVRDLPATVNQLPGMSVKAPQVRYNAGENELDAARALAALMDKEFQVTYKVATQFKATAVRTPTPGYVSVFLCGVPTAST